MEILNKIQKELKAPKGQRNTFGNYNYRSCEDILEAVKPLLGESTLTLSDEIVMFGDRFYVKATATLNEKGTFGSASGASCSAFARESLEKKGMDTAQITGAASSYARKYALNGLFCIDDTKDADTTNNSENPAGYIDDKQKSQILDYFAELNVKQDKFFEYMKIKSLEEMTKADFPKAITALENARKKGSK
jgi:hypothetical protein